MSPPFPAEVDEGLASEFPGLQLAALTCEGPVSADEGVTERLDAIAGRVRGASAIEMRREPVPAAYRALYRQLGVDPDADLPPGEAAVARRLFDGGVVPVGPLSAALELAVLETAVPVYAFDLGSLNGGLVVRPASSGEVVTGRDGVERCDPGRLVVADQAGALCWLFDGAHGRGAPSEESARFVLLAIGAPGVPAIFLDEALQVAAGAIVR